MRSDIYGIINALQDMGHVDRDWIGRGRESIDGAVIKVRGESTGVVNVDVVVSPGEARGATRPTVRDHMHVVVGVASPETTVESAKIGRAVDSQRWRDARLTAAELADEAAARVAAAVAGSAQAAALTAARAAVAPVLEQRRVAAANVEAATAHREAMLAGGQDPRGTRAAVGAAADELAEVEQWLGQMTATAEAASAAVEGLRLELWEQEAKRHMAEQRSKRDELRARFEDAMREFAAELIEIHEAEAAFASGPPAPPPEPSAPAVPTSAGNDPDDEPQEAVGATPDAGPEPLARAAKQRRRAYPAIVR